MALPILLHIGAFCLHQIFLPDKVCFIFDQQWLQVAMLLIYHYTRVYYWPSAHQDFANIPGCII